MKLIDVLFKKNTIEFNFKDKHSTLTLIFLAWYKKKRFKNSIVIINLFKVSIHLKMVDYKTIL